MQTAPNLKLHRAALLEKQQWLIEQLPDHLTVGIVKCNGELQLRVTNETAPTGCKTLSLATLSDRSFIDLPTTICFEIEIDRIKKLLETLRFTKPQGAKSYTCPGTPVRVWLYLDKAARRINAKVGLPENNVSVATAEDMLNALASGDFK